MKRKWKSGDSPGRRNPGKPKDGLVSASVKRPKAFDVTCPTVSEAEVRILNCLVGRPPQGMAELLESLDMSRAAITGLLNDLAANGYVEKTVVKNGGRGRPQFLFAATKLAMRDLFENAREVLSPAVANNPAPDWKRNSGGDPSGSGRQSGRLLRTAHPK